MSHLITNVGPNLPTLHNKHATGRTPRQRGTMNKTEAAYGAYLEGLKYAGEVAWYMFEGIKFRLAGSTYLTPDFVVMLSSGEIQIHEVKGWMQDDAAVKIKVCAESFPFRFFVIRAKPQKDGGGWDIREI
jgi:hypothetical protein